MAQTLPCYLLGGSSGMLLTPFFYFCIVIHIQPMCHPCRTLVFLFTSLLLAGPGTDASCQGYVLTHYNSRNGIGHDNVRTIATDSSGFIWLATWDGLTRYDGTDFVSYFHDPADTATIPYFSVSQVSIDKEDNLWISTDNGQLSLFNRTTEKFSRVRSLGGYPVSDLTCFNPGPDGFMWFILGKGVLKYNPLSKETLFFPWRKNPGDSLQLVFGSTRLLFDENKEPWLTRNDVLKLNLVTDQAAGDRYAAINSFIPIERLPGRIGTFFGEVGYAKIVHDTPGNLWLASMTGLFRYDHARNRFIEYSGDFRKIRFAGDQPVIFYNHDTGLNISFPDRDTLFTIPRETCGLPTTCLMTDPGLLWFSHSWQGGTSAGVVKAVFTPHEFRFINPFREKSGELNVFGLAKDEQGALWIAARDRNYTIRIDSAGVPERKFLLNDREITELWHPRSFLPDTGSMWIGYFFKRLVHYDLATGKSEYHYPGKSIHTTCYDDQGRILFADDGIMRYDPVTRTTEQLLATGDTMYIFTFHRRGDTLWAGCSHSYLLRYNLSTGEHSPVKILEGMTNVEDICDGDDGTLWIATLGTGVCHYNPYTGEKLFYTTAAGLSNNTTYCILRDRNGNIWVSTNDGLSVINPVTGLIRSFGENDGLMIHEFNSDASWVNEDGTFILGGVGGAVEFDPAEVLSEPKGMPKQQIIITELEVSALKRVLDEPVYMTDTVVLRKGDDNFHLSFVVPEYRNPDMTRFRYRLGGDEANWYYTDHNDRNINFSNLSPGWYDLHIEATDINGSWSNNRLLTIRVKPYFYQTILFKITLPLFLLTLFSFIAWSVLKQMNQRERQKRDMLRQQALRAQMNPHFIFNALNSINYFISNNDRLSANRYISDFSKHIRTVLNNMNEDFVRLSVEIDALEDYLKIEHLRFGDKFDYAIKVDQDVKAESFRISPGLIQPFVENAIWHGVMGLSGRKGMITVAVKMNGSGLLCMVEDDGVGRARSEAMKDGTLPKKSRGISLATERMKIINNLLLTNYRITISDLYPDRTETGTRVEIELPLAP